MDMREKREREKEEKLVTWIGKEKPKNLKLLQCVVEVIMHR